MIFFYKTDIVNQYIILLLHYYRYNYGECTKIYRSCELFSHSILKNIIIYAPLPNRLIIITINWIIWFQVDTIHFLNWMGKMMTIIIIIIQVPVIT